MQRFDNLMQFESAISSNNCSKCTQRTIAYIIEEFHLTLYEAIGKKTGQKCINESAKKIRRNGNTNSSVIDEKYNR